MFSKDEVRRALLSQSLKMRSRMPEGDLEKVTSSEDKSKLVAFFHNAGEENRCEEFDKVFVAASLIAYLIHEDVSIPRKSQKSIEVHDESVALVLQYAHRSDAETPEPQIAEPQTATA
jgi:hypothetical protein